MPVDVGSQGMMSWPVGSHGSTHAPRAGFLLRSKAHIAPCQTRCLFPQHKRVRSVALRTRPPVPSACVRTRPRSWPRRGSMKARVSASSGWPGERSTSWTMGGTSAAPAHRRHVAAPACQAPDRSAPQCGRPPVRRCHPTGRLPAWPAPRRACMAGAAKGTTAGGQWTGDCGLYPLRTGRTQRHAAEIVTVHTWHLVLGERCLVVGQGTHGGMPPEVDLWREGRLFHSKKCRLTFHRPSPPNTTCADCVAMPFACTRTPLKSCSNGGSIAALAPASNGWLGERSTW